MLTRFGSLSTIREMEGACGESAVKATSAPCTYIIKVYYFRTGLDRSISTCTNLCSLKSLMLISPHSKLELTGSSLARSQCPYGSRFTLRLMLAGWRSARWDHLGGWKDRGISPPPPPHPPHLIL
ncbi:hypothetical protein Hanom_Chr03g00227361 [Helianthus anomalus]